MNYTERPFVDGLRPADYIPREITEEEEIARPRDNRVIVTETREERRLKAMQKGSPQCTKIPPRKVQLSQPYDLTEDGHQG